MKRLHLFASGKVQGVFYREHCKKAADSLNITGWAINLLDGRVEIVAEGTPKALAEFKKEVMKGSLMAFIQKMDEQEEQATEEFEGFSVR